MLCIFTENGINWGESFHIYQYHIISYFLWLNDGVYGNELRWKPQSPCCLSQSQGPASPFKQFFFFISISLGITFIFFLVKTLQSTFFHSRSMAGRHQKGIDLILFCVANLLLATLGSCHSIHLATG